MEAEEGMMEARDGRRVIGCLVFGSVCVLVCRGACVVCWCAVGAASAAAALCASTRSGRAEMRMWGETERRAKQAMGEARVVSWRCVGVACVRDKGEYRSAEYCRASAGRHKGNLHIDAESETSCQYNIVGYNYCFIYSTAINLVCPAVPLATAVHIYNLLTARTHARRRLLRQGRTRRSKVKLLIGSAWEPWMLAGRQSERHSLLLPEPDTPAKLKFTPMHPTCLLCATPSSTSTVFTTLPLPLAWQTRGSTSRGPLARMPTKTSLVRRSDYIKYSVDACA